MTSSTPRTAALEALADVTGPGNVLRALQALQARFGYVPSDAVTLVADHCNVTRADVFGVLTFYSDLRTTPPAAVEVRVCMGEACQAVGARELLRGTQSAAAADCDVRHVYCMGNCALGPTAVVNGELIGRASVPAVAHLIDHGRGATS
jgi:formate dehydrogenase subunit gamma